jgi:bifunctional DNase/RNase
MVRLKIFGISPEGRAMVVALTPEDGDGSEIIPIWITPPVGYTMVMASNGKHSERPLATDLLLQAIKELGAKVVTTEIYGLTGSTFFAHIVIEHSDGKRITLDARPSDTIIVALYEGLPIEMDEELYESEKLKDLSSEDRVEDEVERFRDFLDNVDPEDFKVDMP